MEFIPLGLRLLLATVFAVAAVGKLRNPGGFPQTLVDFGVAASVAGGLTVLVAVAELATAVFLVPAAWAPWGAALGLLLLVIFTAAVAVNLARGRTPDCQCFGQTSAAPIGAATLVRNVALAACAAGLLVGGAGPDLPAAAAEWIAAPPDERVASLAGLALVAVLAGLAWLAGHLHEQHGRVSRRVDALDQAVAALSARVPSDAPVGLPVGSPAPRFDLPLLAGDRASLETLNAGGVPVLLIFSSSHCPSCAELWPDIGRWQRDDAPVLKVMVVGTGSAATIETKLMGTGVRDVLLAEGSGLAETYRVAGIPSAVVVGPGGTIDSHTVMGPAAIRDLVQQRAGQAR